MNKLWELACTTKVMEYMGVMDGEWDYRVRTKCHALDLWNFHHISVNT